jgi:hypothetical protein
MNNQFFLIVYESDDPKGNTDPKIKSIELFYNLEKVLQVMEKYYYDNVKCCLSHGKVILDLS